MRKMTLSSLVLVSCAVMAMGLGLAVSDVHAAGNPPPTKESKPSGATGTMSGTEQKGSNVDRNANTKTTAPPSQPKK